MGALAPGEVVSLRSATILKVDPLTLNVVNVFFLLRVAIPLPNRVRLDVTPNQSHTSELMPTRNPVQFGADVTDHAKMEPERVTLTGTLTDTPLGLLAAAAAAVFPFQSRALNEYKKLKEIQESRELVFLATKLKYYTNMMIRRIVVNRTRDSGKAIDVTIDFEEVRIVSLAFGALVPDLEKIINDIGSNTIVEGGTQVAEAFG
jgi:hypothetical protein